MSKVKPTHKTMYKLVNAMELDDRFFDSESDIEDELDIQEVEVYSCPFCGEEFEREEEAEQCCDILNDQDDDEVDHDD